MTTLARDSDLQFEVGHDVYKNSFPMVTNDIIYAGAAVGDNGSGYARPYTAGDPFLGFAVAKADNTVSGPLGKAGSNGDIDVEVYQRGRIEAAVTGASAVTDVGKPVFMSDDNPATLTLTASTSYPMIGKVARWKTSTTCVVDFFAESMRTEYHRNASTTCAGDTLAIPITHRFVSKTTSTDAEACTLADGYPGQRLTISLTTDGGGSATITPTTKTGFATIVLADAKDTVTLEFVDETVGWIFIGSTGTAGEPVIT